MDRGRDLYLADFYSLELRELGTSGFTAWLAGSFRGPVAAPLSPHFYTEELETEAFGEIFSRIADLLAPEAHTIASTALVDLLEEDASEFLTYEGLFSIARIAEALELNSGLDLLHRALRARLDIGSANLRLPDSDLEVYSLREALESFFRAGLNDPRHMRQVCEWAFDFLGSSLPHEGALKPVLAPAYVLARIWVRDGVHSDGAKASLAAHMTGKLLSAFYVGGDPFPAYFGFQSKGERYPFDIDSLLACVDEWLDPAVADYIMIVADLAGRFDRPLEIDDARRTATRPDSRPSSRSKTPRNLGELYAAARLMPAAAELAGNGG